MLNRKGRRERKGKEKRKEGKSFVSVIMGR
jgi:hypothetical protein